MRVEVILILGTLVISANYGRKSMAGDAAFHESSRSRNGSLPKMTIGLIVPHTNFGVREYTKAVNRAVGSIHKDHIRTKDQSRFKFLQKYEFTQHQVKLTMMKLTPSPTGI